MQQNIKKIVAAFCCCVWLATGYAQEQRQPIDKILRDPSNNYYTIKQKADAYFERWGTAGTGYKEYKRWEFLVKNNIAADGTVPDMVKNNQQALDDYRANNVQPNGVTASTSSWIPLGQVNPSYPPGFGQNGWGRASSIDFRGSDIWVSTPGGGMWFGDFVSGSTFVWSPKTDGIPNLAVQDIEIAPTNNNIMYAMTGAVGSASGYRSTGVIKSIDGGTTWQLTGLNFSGTGGTKGYKLLVNPSDANTVWACTDAGLYRTTDGGTTWPLATYYTTVGGTQFNFSNNSYDIVYQPGSSSVLYATGAGPYFYKSTDGGATFLRVDRAGAGLPATGDRIQIGVSAANNAYVYLLYGDGNAYQGLYRSTNSGSTFTLRSSTPNILGGQAWRNICIAVSPSNAEDVYVGGLDVYKSTTGGATGGWTQIAFSNTTNAAQFCHADIFELKCDANYLWAATDGGIYRMIRTTDSWVSLNNNMQTGQVYRMGIDPTATAGFVTVGLQDNGTYRNTGAQYLNIGGADGMETVVQPSNTNVIYLSTQNGAFYRSDNGGTSNTFIRSGGGNWTTPVVLRPGFDTHVYIGYTNIDYNTTSGTGAWSTITTGFSTPIESLEFAPSNSAFLYATDASSIRRFSLSAGVWSAATVITGTVPTGSITELAVDPTSSANLVAVIGGYSSGQKVYRSLNANGVSPTWTNISANLPNVPINCVTIDDDVNNTIYVGTDIGVFVYNDVLQNWVMYSNNLPVTRVYDLEINSALSPHRLYAGTFGRGVFYTEVYTSCGTSTTLSGSITGLQYTEMGVSITSTQVIDGGIGTSVAYNSGSIITLNPGFNAKASIKKFEAYLQGCTGAGSPPRPLKPVQFDVQPAATNPEGEGMPVSESKLGSSNAPANTSPAGDAPVPVAKPAKAAPKTTKPAKPEGDN